MAEAQVLAVTRQLVAFGRRELTAIQNGNLLQLDWLTLQIEQLVAELKELSDSMRLSPEGVQELQALAAEFEQLRRQSQQALAAHPGMHSQVLDAAAAACAHGNELQQAGRCRDAVACYQLALRLCPTHVEAHNNLGNALQALEQYDAAVDQYQAVLAQQPDSVEALVNCGNALHALHRSDEAVPLYLTAAALDPGLPEVHSNLGNAYRAVGRMDDAVSSYERALELRPEYVEAHTNLANALLALHRYDEAIVRYQRALDIKPNYVVAHNNLGIALQELNRLDEALAHHEAALAIAPDDRRTHQGLALAYLQLGREEDAQRHGRIGFCRPVDRYPFRGQGRPVRVLVLRSALGGNVVTDSWLDDHVFQKSLVDVDFIAPDFELPPHDLIVNAIGEADRCPHALASAAALLAGRASPVINQPDRVLATGRVANACRLGAIPDVVAPPAVMWARTAFESEDAAQQLAAYGLRWPILLRSPGFHTGEHFVKVDKAEDLAAAARALPGARLLAMQFVDTSAPDGKYRKYRALMIDGQLHPLHAAVSRNWKVHYFSADMAGNPEHRAEDAAFLADMPGVLGPRAVGALEAIRDMLALDYGGIDFGLDREGRVVVFEANATMVAPPPAAGEEWAYRQAAVDSVTAAVRQMLLARAQPAAI